MSARAKILIIFFFAFAIGIGVYLVVKNNTKPLAVSSPSVGPISGNDEFRRQIIDRDNRRINDLSILGMTIVDYVKHASGQYLKTSGTEKISDETNSIHKILKDSGYLLQSYQDPLPDRYYYGYDSDGSDFTLTAVLENKNDTRCSVQGNFCVYKLRSEEVIWMLVESEEEYEEESPEGYYEEEE